MSARRVFVVGGLACLLGLLLNANAIEHTAETKPIGWERTVGVAAMRPVVAVSHALRVDRPREWADRALGHERSEPVDLDALVAAPTSSTVPATVPPPGATTTTAPPPLRAPTAEAPLRLWVGGDSLTEAFGDSLVTASAATGVISAELDFQYSSGLARPDCYDWPGHFVEVIADRHPEVMVVMFGANDAQGMELPDGVHQVGDPEWNTEYTRRVDLVMTYLTQQGVRVYWIGQPIMRSGEFDQKMQLLNGIYAQQADAHDGVVYFDSRPLFQDTAGGYTDYLPDQGGQLQLARQGDGIHLTTFGGDRLAAPVLERILADTRPQG